MDDKLLMNGYLMILKSNTEVFVHGTLESSNTNVRKLLHKCLDETLESQANSFDSMKEYGFYEVNNIKNSEIEKTIDKLDQ